MSVKSTARKAGKAARKARKSLTEVGGPSPNPATNLLILDVAMRGAALIAARMIERGTLRMRYDAGKASNIVMGRSMVQALVATGAARVATRSVTGFVAVTGGLLAKSVLDRTLSRRKSVRRGEQQLAEQAAAGADDE